MTRVCVRCGWLVLDGARCRRDDGPSLEWRSAARACGVSTLRALLNVEPELRVARFRLTGRRIRQAAAS